MSWRKVTKVKTLRKLYLYIGTEISESDTEFLVFIPRAPSSGQRETGTESRLTFYSTTAVFCFSSGFEARLIDMQRHTSEED